jgi:hypothetical protein
MSFQPFVSGTGLSGWSLLMTTLTTQKSAFNKNSAIQTDTRYFAERFYSIERAEDITEDRRLLRIVLGAYGLTDDIDNRFFIRKVMEEGTLSSSALANKLSDRRYRTLASDFDFSTMPPKHLVQTGLVQKTIEAFRTQAFEQKIGERDRDMRLALSFSRDLLELSQKSSTESAGWFQLLATPPLREVIQSALGFPDSFAQLDIDDQHSRIRRKAEQVFGTSDLKVLSTEEMAEDILRRFFVMREVSVNSASSSFQTALVLLTSGTMVQS